MGPIVSKVDHESIMSISMHLYPHCVYCHNFCAYGRGISGLSWSLPSCLKIMGEREITLSSR